MRTFCLALFLLSSTLFAFEPLTQKEEKLLDTLYNTFCEEHPKYQDVAERDSGRASMILFLIAEDQYKHNNYELVQLVSKAIYLDTSSAVYRDDAFELWVSSALCEIDTSYALIIKQHFFKNRKVLITMDDTLLRNVVYSFHQSFTMRQERIPPFLFDYERLKEQRSNNPALQKIDAVFSERIYELLDPYDITIDEKPETLRDLAVEILLQQLSSEWPQEVFFPDVAEVMAYGIEQDSLNVDLRVLEQLYIEIPSILKPVTSLREIYSIGPHSLPILLNVDEPPVIAKEVLHSKAEALEKLLEYDSTHLQALFTLKSIYQYLDESEKALSALEKLSRLDMRYGRWAELQEERFKLHFVEGNYEAVEEVHKEILVKAPYYDKSVVQYDFVNAFLHLKEPKKAFNYLVVDGVCTTMAVLQQQALYSETMALLAEVSLLAKEFEVLRTVESYYDSGYIPLSKPEDSLYFAQSLVSIGHSYLVENEKRTAREYYERAQALYAIYEESDTLASQEAFHKLFKTQFEAMESYGFSLAKKRYIIRKLKLPASLKE